MKYLYKSALIIVLLLSGFGGLQNTFAQEATESVAELDKVQHPAFTTTFAKPAEIVEGALLLRLQQDHIRAKERRHIISSKAVVYPKISNAPLDIYFQTESKKTGKHESATTLNMFISKGRDNFIGGKYDEDIAKKALTFLEQFHHDVAVYALRQEIIAKENALEKAQDDYKDRLDDKQDLYDDLYDRKKELSAASGRDIKKTKRKINKINKKIHQAEKDIREGERDIEQRKGEIQALRSRLSEMKGRKDS